jgi:hypothetical protein
VKGADQETAFDQGMAPRTCTWGSASRTASTCSAGELVGTVTMSMTMMATSNWVRVACWRSWLRVAATVNSACESGCPTGPRAARSGSVRCFPAECAGWRARRGGVRPGPVGPRNLELLTRDGAVSFVDVQRGAAGVPAKKDLVQRWPRTGSYAGLVFRFNHRTAVV